MSKFFVTALLLSLVSHGTKLAGAWDDQDFFTYCPPSQCSKHGPDIRFPFRLESSNTSSLCGGSCLKFACSGQDTILDHQYLGRCKVTAINYSSKLLTIIPLVNSLSSCPLQKLISKSTPFDVSRGYNHLGYATLVSCSKEITPNIDIADYFVGPISCLGNATQFSYMVDAFLFMSALPLDCKVLSDGLIPIPLHNSRIGPSRFKESTERILSFAEMTISSACPDRCSSYNPYTCEESCELDGGRCAFSSQKNQSFCMLNRHGIISNWSKPYTNIIVLS
jgi:hypothetical protein